MFDAQTLRERQERWRRFHEWEAEEEVKRAASRTVEEKLSLYWDIYCSARQRRPDLFKSTFASDEELLEEPHIQHLIDVGRRLREADQKRKNRQ